MMFPKNEDPSPPSPKRMLLMPISMRAAGMQVATPSRVALMISPVGSGLASFFRMYAHSRTAGNNAAA